MYALNIGLKLKATKAEIKTDTAITTPNSRNNLPVCPCINNIGKNTAAKVIVVEITAK